MKEKSDGVLFVILQAALVIPRVFFDLLCEVPVVVIPLLLIVSYFSFWIPFLTTLGVVGIVICVWRVFEWRVRMIEAEQRASDQQIRDEQQLQEKQNEIERQAEADANLAESAKDALKCFQEYLTPCFIVDSNIWMGEDYDSFFLLLDNACCAKGYVIHLFADQFDEISNIKKSTRYGDNRNRLARLAINRIDAFQEKGRLRIDLPTIDAKRGAYADPQIVKVITEQAMSGVRCTFISNDKELKIRVRQHLADHAKADWRIVDMSTILTDCHTYCAASSRGLI